MRFTNGLTPNHEKKHNQNTKKYVSREKRTAQNHEKIIGASNQHGSYPTETIPGASKSIRLKLSSNIINLIRKSF
jgi:hypothetical protein